MLHKENMDPVPYVSLSLDVSFKNEIYVEFFSSKIAKIYSLNLKPITLS